MDHDTLGARIKTLRVRRRMTQSQLADAAHVGVDLIAKLEQGQRLSARLTSLTAIALALDVSAGELMGRTGGLAAGGEESEVPRLRKVILDLTSPDVEPPTLDDLSGALGRLWDLYFDGRYGEVSRRLPACIEESRAAVRAAASSTSPRAHAILAELLQMAAETLTHLDKADLAHLALLGAMDAARKSGDELLFATQIASRAWILSRQGLWDDAGRLASAAADDVEPRLSTATMEQVAVWGELLRYNNLAQARAGRHGEAAELLGLMNAAANRMGGDKRQRYSAVRFGPTMVAMRAVDNANSREEYPTAISLAEQVRHPDQVPPQIQSRYLLNVAWALKETWRNRQAVATLLRAESVAPQAIIHEGIAAATVEDLLPRRSKQRLPGLIGLAERLGVEVD
jgi:transcriptional regulator with XRE-family HTH domain